MNKNRSVFVANKNSDGKWYPFGRLSFAKGLYVFVYLHGVKTQGQNKSLPGMSDLNKVYKSETLFPFFENRLLTNKRSEYQNFLSWSGFSPQESPDPLAILETTEGKKATDGYEVFPCPVQNKEDGLYHFKFFLHGLRHMPSSSVKAINTLSKGERLYLMLDLQNQYNSAAVTLRTEDRQIIGYLPNYMTDEAHRLLNECTDDIIATVSRVNSDAPLNFRLLCELTACWNEGVQPFSSEEFTPISKDVPRYCGVENA